ALGLHPHTKHVFIVSGTLENDKRFESLARNQLRGHETQAQIAYLTDLSLNGLTDKIKSLPEQSLVLYAWFQTRDERGKLLESPDVLDVIAPIATAPIYGLSSGNVGHGIVGGQVFTLEGNGSRAAEIALKVVNGVKAQDIQIAPAPTEAMFDWRELERWKIDEARLPLGSVIRFRTPSFWHSYRWHIVV